MAPSVLAALILGLPLCGSIPHGIAFAWTREGAGRRVRSRPLPVLRAVAAGTTAIAAAEADEGVVAAEAGPPAVAGVGNDICCCEVAQLLV